MIVEFDQNYKPKKKGRKPKFENKENFTEKKKKIEVDIESDLKTNLPNIPIKNNKEIHYTNNLENSFHNQYSHSKNPVNERRKRKTNLQLLIESVPKLNFRPYQIPFNFVNEPTSDSEKNFITCDDKQKINSVKNMGKNGLNYLFESSLSSESPVKKKKLKRVKQRIISSDNSFSSEYIPHKDHGSKLLSIDKTITEEENKKIKVNIKKKIKRGVDKSSYPIDDEMDLIDHSNKLIKCDFSIKLPKDNIVPIAPTKNPGNINYDTPLKIVYAKHIIGKGIYCMIEWKKNKEGKKPEPTYYPSDDLKKLYPQLVLDFYEKRMESVKPREPESINKIQERFLKKRKRKSKEASYF